MEYLHPKTRRNAFMDQFEFSDDPGKSRRIKADVVLPIQNSFVSDLYLGKKFSHVVKLEHILYTGVLEEVEPANKMTSLFMSLIRTWPLLLMTMSMAFGAGALMWVLVSKNVVSNLQYLFVRGRSSTYSFYLS